MSGKRYYRAKLEIGGKYGRDIVFKGNKRFLPAHIRGVIGSYFSQWNTLRDIALYPRLVADLGQANASERFRGTDWEKLNAYYEAHMVRYSVAIDGRLDDDGRPRFSVAGVQSDVARPLATLISEYCHDDGTLIDEFDIWRVEKLLRRAKANIRFEQGFGPVLRKFGERGLSLEESLSFFRQVQAYHAPDFLAAELKEVLAPVIDAVHTLKQPTGLGELVDNLRGRARTCGCTPLLSQWWRITTSLSKWSAPWVTMSSRNAVTHGCRWCSKAPLPSTSTPSSARASAS